MEYPPISEVLNPSQLEAVTWAQGHLLEEVIQHDFPDFGHRIELIKEMREVYQHKKREHNYCDFDDLLVSLRQLLRDHADLRSRLKTQFEHILVKDWTGTLSSLSGHLTAGSRPPGTGPARCIGGGASLDVCGGDTGPRRLDHHLSDPGV